VGLDGKQQGQDFVQNVIPPPNPNLSPVWFESCVTFSTIYRLMLLISGFESVRKDLERVLKKERAGVYVCFTQGLLKNRMYLKSG